MLRKNLFLILLGALVIAALGIMIVATIMPPAPGSVAHFRSLSASNTSAPPPPHSVPVDTRRAAADTCQGYNLELQEAAGIQTRLGHHGEAQRLLAMRRDCAIAPEIVRSAR